MGKYLVVGAAVIATIGVVVFLDPSGTIAHHRLDMGCRDDLNYNAAFEFTRRNWEQNHPTGEMSAYYSTLIGGCVSIFTDEIQNTWSIRDMHNALSFSSGALFWCDRDGIDNIIPEVVRRYHGLIDDVPYEIYLDDANGGPPRTIHTPDHIFSPNECYRSFGQRLRAYRFDQTIVRSP